MSADLWISKKWNGEKSAVDPYHVTFSISQTTGDVMINVDASFHDDPRPPFPAGKLENLAEFEVVDLFMSGYPSAYHEETPYLQIEVGPYGHYRLGFFLEEGDFENVDTNIDFDNLPRTKIDYEKKRWKCEISVPSFLLPEPMCGEDLSVCWRVNAYAVFGPLDNRQYLAYSTIPGPQINFHQLDYFQEIQLFETLEVRDQVDRTISIATEKFKSTKDSNMPPGAGAVGNPTVFDLTEHLRQALLEEESGDGGGDEEIKIDVIARQIRDRLLKSNIPSELLELEEKYQRQIQADEFVILHDMIWKRKSLSFRRRKLILTSKPRLFYLDSNGIFRGQIPWTMTKRLKLTKVRWFCCQASFQISNFVRNSSTTSVLTLPLMTTVVHTIFPTVTLDQTFGCLVSPN
jgi:hypothetical protein